MSFFSRVLGRNSTYALGIVITAFALDRTFEIVAEGAWKNLNKGVSKNKEFLLYNRSRRLFCLFLFLSFHVDWTGVLSK